MLGHGIQAIREHLAGLPDSMDVTVEDLRSAYDKAERAFALGDDIRVETLTVNGVPAERLTPGTVDGERTVLYLHGGGYALGSPRSHRHMVANLAREAHARALVIDYRLAPEHRFPAAVDDAVSGYRWLLEQGIPSGRIVVAGDSAGGGLTVATLVALRDQGIDLPAGGVCISPWTDLTNSAESYRTRAEADPMVTHASIERWTTAYLGDADPLTPLASPAHADLKGLPPLLIQVGGDEVLVDDSRLLARRAAAAGVQVDLQIWEGMIHVWHWFAEYLDEAGEATRDVARFIETRTG